MPHAELQAWLAAGCLVVLVAVLAVRLSSRTGLPTLLLYLGLGLLLGESGLGLQFEDFALAENLGLVALALILAEGGLTTQWGVVRPALGFAVVLSTVGVAVSVSVVAAAGHWLLGLEPRSALLLGAVVSSTDAAAVFSVLRRLPLRRRLVAALEAESGLNDAPVVILVLLLVSDGWADADPWATLGLVAYQLVAAVVLGLAVGRAGQELLARVALPAAGLYPVAGLALALLAYAVAGLAGASGFLAVYVAGLWLGNAPLPHHRATVAFSDAVATLAQIGLFVMLGLLASPGRLPEAVVPALVAGFVLTFLARPLSVVVSAAPFRRPWRDQVFLSWAGLRGAVPIVLATIGAAAGLPGGQQTFDIVFLLVVVYTLVQAPTLPRLARRLRVLEDASPREVEVESAPLGTVGGELLELTVPARSRLPGVSVDELRLPAGAVVSLVVRDGRTFVPDGATALAAGDQLLVVVTSQSREATERRLRAVGRGGRLAGWTDAPR